MDELRRFRTGHLGHHQVHDDDVGLQLESQFDGRASVVGLADALEVVFPRDERGEPDAQQHVVVGDENANLVLHDFLMGMRTVTLVPCPGWDSIVRIPFIFLRRSSMPARP